MSEFVSMSEFVRREVFRLSPAARQALTAVATRGRFPSETHIRIIRTLHRRDMITSDGWPMAAGDPARLTRHGWAVFAALPATTEKETP